ncbi:unnamed protein product [Leptosia nina]|uniref:Exoribonuclease phosphorolytic domain-containing protein n=1 Tax=Leptosia nina TaxID=320188 RepID=A0AAV1J3J3_9NEOP
MPLDYRRFNGPEDSVSYKQFSTNFTRSYDELFKGLFDENGKRIDGREFTEARPLYTKTNVISQAKGSAYVELKNTKVVCSVFDPREIVGHQNEYSIYGQIYCEVKFAPFSCPRRRRGLAPDTDERALSANFKTAIQTAIQSTKFRNFQMDVFVYILEHDGACLAAAINAACLALTDAVVPMMDIFSARTAAVINNQIFVDPTEAEENLALMPTDNETNHGIITLTVIDHLRNITDLQQIGSIDADCLIKVIDILLEECAKLMPLFKDLIIDNVFEQYKEHQVYLSIKKQVNEELSNKVKEWTLIVKDK